MSRKVLYSSAISCGLFSPERRMLTLMFSIAMEVRLIIYRQLCTPIHHEWLDGEGEDLPGSCISFDFPPAVLLVNKRINAEAKVVFYGENTFVTHIETMDVDQDYDTVEADTVRRRIMLGHVKKAHIHLKLSGQLIAEWRWAGSMADYLDYIRRSMTTVVRDFIAAPALRLVVISFEDAINDDPWIPDLNYTAETLDPRELEEARYSALEILGSLEYLPVRISLELGKVSVDTADGYENILEERFASTFGEIIASRATEKVAPQNLASMVVI